MIKYLRQQNDININIIDDDDERIMDIALTTKNIQIIYELYENGALFSKNAHQKSKVINNDISKQFIILCSQELEFRIGEVGL